MAWGWLRAARGRGVWEVFNICRDGEEKRLADVEAALHKRAVGYQTTETRTTLKGDAGTEDVVKTRKFVPPDVTAMVYFLKNRAPERWRDRDIRTPKQTEVGPDPLLDAIREGGAIRESGVDEAEDTASEP